jgi:hypothetical protein
MCLTIYIYFGSQVRKLGICHQPFPHSPHPSILFTFSFFGGDLPTLPYQSTHVISYKLFDMINQIIKYSGGKMISITNSFYNLYTIDYLRNYKKA